MALKMSELKLDISLLTPLSSHFLTFWWSWRESNPRPDKAPQRLLHA